MANYLVAKCNTVTKSYELKTAEPNKPYLRVSNSYLPLSSGNTNTGLYIKVDSKNYIPVESYTTTTRSLVGYSGYDTCTYKKTSIFSLFAINYSSAPANKYTAGLNLRDYNGMITKSCASAKITACATLYNCRFGTITAYASSYFTTTMFTSNGVPDGLVYATCTGTFTRLDNEYTKSITVSLFNYRTFYNHLYGTFSRLVSSTICNSLSSTNSYYNYNSSWTRSITEPFYQTITTTIQ